MRTIMPSGLDRGAWATKSLPTLLADKRGRALRVVKLRFGEDAISTDAASKPRGERLLVGEAGRIHRRKFWRKQFRITAPYSKHH